jgi:hypothetical protein
LTLDGLAQKHYLLFSSHGTYTISGGLEDPKKARDIADRIRADRRPSSALSARPATFSTDALVRPIELVQGNFSSTLWFHDRHSTHYVPRFGDGDPSFRNDRYITYLHRVDGYVEERLEPVSRTEDQPDLIEEWLYLHYQEEKKKGESLFGKRGLYFRYCAKPSWLIDYSPFLFTDWFKQIPHRSNSSASDWIMLTEGHDAGGFRSLPDRDDL